MAEALAEEGHNRTRTAARLGITRKTLLDHAQDAAGQDHRLRAGVGAERLGEAWQSCAPLRLGGSPSLMRQRRSE